MRCLLLIAALLLVPVMHAAGDIAPATQPATAPTHLGLAPDTRQKLRQILTDSYDTKNFGFGTGRKQVDWDIIEFLLLDTERRGPAAWKSPAIVLNTLNAGLKLIDPVWGGVYQYSDGGVWDQPHFKKPTSHQAEELRIYSLAAMRYPDFAAGYVKGAGQIYGYLCNFMTSPDGAFYASQDAPGQRPADYFKLDDAGRRKIGVPRIDQNLYARENGLAISGLATYYMLTKDKAVLERAKKAIQWALKSRAIKGDGDAVGFAHGDNDQGRFFLADTLAMGRGFYALFDATGEKEYLTHALAAARFIAQKFPPGADPAGGFVSTAGAPPNLDENTSLAVWARRLARKTGDPAATEIFTRALRYSCSPAVAESRRSIGGVLLADEEAHRK